MKIILEQLPRLAKEKLLENKKYFSILKKKKLKRLDLIMQELHEDEFKRTDCLSCANCCKTTSPIFTEKDIIRISKKLRLKEFQFIKQYLFRDKDDFMVLQNLPCAFLDIDNSCIIYDYRPKACREYPHTNRRKFIQITDLAIKNADVCPAVYNIIEALKKKLPM